MPPAAESATFWLRKLPKRLKNLLRGRPRLHRQLVPGPVEGSVVQLNHRGGPLHFHHPLGDPDWVAAADAALLKDDDAVIGIKTDRGAWALPWWVMKNHHVAHLDLGGRSVTVGLCEACVSCSAWDLTDRGGRPRVRQMGLHNGRPIHEDVDNGDYWDFFDGVPLTGEGAALSIDEWVPVVHVTWGEWRELYPDTLVESGVNDQRTGHGAAFPNPAHELIVFDKETTAPLDDRLDAAELVVGVMVGDARTAYPLAAVHDNGGTLDDVVGDVPVTVVASTSWMSAVFERTGAHAAADLAIEGREIVDRATGRRYDLLGNARDGGDDLRWVMSRIEKWRPWSANNPHCRLVAPTRTG